VSSDEKRAIKVISGVLGSKIWDHSIIIFTCGDMVTASSLHARKSNRTALLQHEISKYSSSRASSAVPSVITTNTSTYLPDGTEWLSVLFTTVFSRLSERAGKSFLVSAAPRLRPQGAGSTSTSKDTTAINLTPAQSRTVKEKLEEWYPEYSIGGAAIGTFLFGPAGLLGGAVVGGVIDGIRWLMRKK
jgi:hypothetical protein